MMIAREMVDREVSVRQVAAQLGVDESTLRYRLRRAADAVDGRGVRATAMAGWDARVDAVLARFGDARVVPAGTGRCEAQLLHDTLVREFAFTGSYQAVRRYLKRRFAAFEWLAREEETGRASCTLGSIPSFARCTHNLASAR